MAENMRVLPCYCVHDSQDKLYGPGKRLHNACAPKKEGKKETAGTRWRCTVCLRESY